MNIAESAGALLIVTGIVVIAGYGLYVLVQVQDIPAAIRLGVIALSVGFLVVMLALVRERIIDLRSEKKAHEGVKR